MNNKIEFENGPFGIKAIIKGVWQDTYLKLLFKKEVQELELNEGKGWHGDNLDFLKFIPNLKSIIIIDFSIQSIQPIHSLISLTHLRLLTNCKKPINFMSFPELEYCDFEWIKGSESLFECKRLKGLGINRFNNKSSALFANLNDLERLTILNAKIENIDGINELKKLKYLSISNLKNLNSLKGLQNLHELEELEIQRCKGLYDVSIIFKLTKLKRLLLIDLGDISSIMGLENLTGLRDFLFYESTNVIDGDLFPITKLSSLRKISYQNRKHYTHKREDFVKLYA